MMPIDGHFTLAVAFDARALAERVCGYPADAAPQGLARHAAPRGGIVVHEVHREDDH